MKCPYCGAELQENARFCLYCMHTLQEKTELTAPPAKKHRRSVWLIAGLAVVLLGVIAVFALVKWQDTRKKDGSSPAAGESVVNTSPSGATDEAGGILSEATEPPPYRTITDFDWFYFDAISVSEEKDCTALWEPSSLYLAERTDGIEVYRAPVHLQDAALGVYFSDEGEEILISLTNLTQDTLDDGRKLADCLVSAVCYGIDCEIPDLASAALEESGEAPCFTRLQVDDPAGEGNTESLSRAEFTLEIGFIPLSTPPSLRLTYELRTRSVNGDVFYDMFLLFWQE